MPFNVLEFDYNHGDADVASITRHSARTITTRSHSMYIGIATLLQLGLFLVGLQPAYALLDRLPARVSSGFLTANNDRNIEDVPEFRKSVSINCTGRAVGDVFEQISVGKPFTLRVKDRSIRFQRVTLEIRSQPLFHVMEQVVYLLSHGDVSTNHPQYHWESVEDGTNSKRLVYELRVGAAAFKAQRDELDRPRRDALQYLKDMRDELNLPVDKRMSHPHVISDGLVADIDRTPAAHALSNLTDEQLENLMDGEAIYVPAAPLRDSLEQDYYWRMGNMRARGDQREFPPFAMGTDEWYTIGISDSFFIEDPLHSQTYMIDLIPGKVKEYFTGGSHLGGVDMDMLLGVGLLSKPSPNTNPKVYDLTPILQAPKVTDDQRRNLGFNLAALAQAAHIDLLAEQFPKPPRSSGGLRIVKGTIADIANDLCTIWNLRVTKVGDDYVFWDRNWARERQADVPEYELDRIRKLVARRGGELTRLDQIELCTRFLWLQMAITLPYAIPEVARVGSFREYYCNRVVGLMTPDERNAALAPSGLPVSQLAPTAMDVVLNELDYHRYLGQYHPETATTFADDTVLQGTVHLNSDSRSASNQVSELNIDPYSLTIRSKENAVLWQNAEAR